MPEVVEVDEKDVGRVEDGGPGGVLAVQEFRQLRPALGEVIPREVYQVGRVLEQPVICDIYVDILTDKSNNCSWEQLRGREQ